MEIENNKECFVLLWRMLVPTKHLLRRKYKRFCIRNVLKEWFEQEATNALPLARHLALGHQQASLYGPRSLDDFIWEVCNLCEQAGWDELPSPSLYPRKHREFLRAIVAVRTGRSFYQINLRALDAAYRIVFPNSTPINVNKKVKSNVTKRN